MAGPFPSAVSYMGISFTSDMVRNVLDYVGLLWADIKLPVLLILGVMVGFFIINGIIEGISGGIFKHTKGIDEEED